MNSEPRNVEWNHQEEDDDDAECDNLFLDIWVEHSALSNTKNQMKMENRM